MSNEKIKDARGLYIVHLPDRNIGVDAYAEVPLVGQTTATSEAGAVSQYVMRHVDRNAGRLILHGLKETIGPLEWFATILPEVDHAPGDKPLTRGELSRYGGWAFALELALKAGRETPLSGDCVRSRHLLAMAGIA